MHQQLIVLDIETVPMVEHYEQLDAKWKTLWEKKARFWLDREHKSIEEIWQEKAGIYAEFAKVICIGWGYLDITKKEHVQLFTKSLYSTDEADILKVFISHMDTIFRRHPSGVFAGHNIAEFDLPFLCRRMIVNGLGLPHFMPQPNAKPWDFISLDTIKWWRFGDYKHFISLDLLANVLGIPSSKQDMDGSMVSTYYYQKQDLESINKYCQQDVILTAQIILRYFAYPLLQATHIHTYT